MDVFEAHAKKKQIHPGTLLGVGYMLRHYCSSHILVIYNRVKSD
jgi:hypothetical protein